MQDYNVAILGCGTVGSGAAKIIKEMSAALAERSGKNIKIAKIVTPNPTAAAQRAGIELELFANPKEGRLTKEELDKAITEVINDKNIDLVVETIGGDSDYIRNIHEAVIKSGKNIVSANKSLLAKTGMALFDMAKEHKVKVGFEGAVCGAIPIIKGLTECFTGDEAKTIYGIMNGTSNFILSNMSARGISFETALKEAQEKGYAEADPTLDINGGDAANKLKILIQMVFGIDASTQNFKIEGIENITEIDVSFAKKIKSVIKLICYAHRSGGNVYASVRPMMLHKDLFLADINGATNAVALMNQYAGPSILVGQGAGMTETGSSVVSDIVHIARGGGEHTDIAWRDNQIRSFEEHVMNFNIILKVKDIPGVTGTAATMIGNEGINIITVGPNIHSGEYAYFSVVTEEASLERLNRALEKMRAAKPGVFTDEIKIFPVLK